MKNSTTEPFNTANSNAMLSAVICVLLLFYCENKPIKELSPRKINFIIENKFGLKSRNGENIYYLKSKDTAIECGTSDFANFNVGDTLKLEIPREGFFKGTVFLDNSR